METKKCIGWEYRGRKFDTEAEALEEERKGKIYDLSQMVLHYPFKQVKIAALASDDWKFWNEMAGKVGEIREIERALREAYAPEEE